MAEMTRRLEELDAFVRSQRAPKLPPTTSKQPPLLPHPPAPFNDGATSGASSHSRSRSRTRSRAHSKHRSLVRLRRYAQIHVPCSFSNERAAIPPAAPPPVKDVFSGAYYPSTLQLAWHIIAINRQKIGTGILTWEKVIVLRWARALDYLLLEANEGSSSLWSESAADCLLRGFLEMAIRANPDDEPPPELDPSTAAKLRRLRFGKPRDYGPLSSHQQNNNNGGNNRQRRPNNNNNANNNGNQRNNNRLAISDQPSNNNNNNKQSGTTSGTNNGQLRNSAA